MFGYRVVTEYSDEDECWIARAPAFAGVAAHGGSADAAVRQLEVALEAAIASMYARKQPIPECDAGNVDVVQVLAKLPPTPAWIAARAQARDEERLEDQGLVWISDAGSERPPRGST